MLDLAGAPVAQLRPEAGGVPDFTTPSNPTLAPGPDYAGSIWRASPNYSARPAGTAGKVKMAPRQDGPGGCLGEAQGDAL